MSEKNVKLDEETIKEKIQKSVRVSTEKIPKNYWGTDTPRTHTARYRYKSRNRDTVAFTTAENMT